MALPPDYVIDAINQVQSKRGWIISSVAQIEFMLGEIISRSLDMVEYNTLPREMPLKISKMIRRVYSILEIEGFFSQFEGELIALLHGLEDRIEQRHLLAHGFMEVFHDPNGDILFRLRKWERVEAEVVVAMYDFKIVQIDYQQAQLRALSDQAADLFRRIHEQLGLVQA